MCAFFQFWSFENYTTKFRPLLRHKISCSLSPSPSTHLLLPSSSYPWLPMVVWLFLTHLLLDVASPITFSPSPFRCHWSSRSKGLMKKIQGLQSPHGATSVFFVVCCEIFFMKEWLLLVEPYLVDSLRRSVVWYLLCVECNYSQERIIVVNEYTCVISLWSFTSLHY